MLEAFKPAFQNSVEFLTERFDAFAVCASCFGTNGLFEFGYAFLARERRAPIPQKLTPPLRRSRTPLTWEAGGDNHPLLAQPAYPPSKAPTHCIGVSEAYTPAIECTLIKSLVMSRGDAPQRRPSPSVVWMALLGGGNQNCRIEENLHGSYAFRTDSIRSSRTSSRMRSQFAPGCGIP